MREDTLLRPATTDTTAPLTGVALTATGRGFPLRLAIHQLRLLGAELTEHHKSSAPARLTLGVGSGAVTCALDWAGPVAMPLASEADVQAACGLAAVHGRRYGTPQPLGIEYASAVAGVLAVQGLLAARLTVLRGGSARRVRTSVAGAALLAVGQYLAAATADDPPEPTRADTGPPPFTSADGVRFEIEALDPGQWLAFWSGLGVARPVVGQGWPPFQLRFATGSCALPAELDLATRQLSYRQLTDAAVSVGVSIVPVRAQGPSGYRLPPWRIESVPGPGSPLPPAPAGAGPLAGLVVVEMTRRLQGPLAGHLLALLGAEVIRVEPLGGDPLRGVPPMVGEVSARFHALNRNKRVFEADPRSPAGRRAIRELIGGAEVFLHNLAPGKAESFGLDPGQLLAEQPGLVHAWASGWGELFNPDGNAFGSGLPVGTDYLVQAHSGLAALVTPPGRPVAPALLTITDVFGGLVSATGVLAALVARAGSGFGQRVDSSLFSAAVALLDMASPPDAPPARFPAATPEELAADPRFAAALQHDSCVLPRAPWQFDA
ncbi:CoA transferase [Kitasatospora acidiphila]|uniref:CoA transferase n=1 Tax=Kitasatospora acidiphila TaxID=2567942 RepID=A0A540VY87_9ACTN|nr:CoA transferase [Kitasatospora acidiphila]TQF01730.1 CoA transferase [Kitasatospora acidiphila]